MVQSALRVDGGSGGVGGDGGVGSGGCSGGVVTGVADSATLGLAAPGATGYFTGGRVAGLLYPVNDMMDGCFILLKGFVCTTITALVKLGSIVITCLGTEHRSDAAD